MRQVIASSLNRKTVNQGRFLSYILLLQRLLRYSAVEFIIGVAVLIFFPVSLAHAAPILYIPNQLSNTVSVIDGSTYSMIKTISVGKEPYGVGVSPDGKTVFITNLAGDTVSVISTDTNTVTNTVSVGDFPFGVVVSPDGRYAYVANAADDNLSVIDTSGYSVVAHIAVGDDPHGVVIHPDGSKLYVTNYFGSTVSVINTSTRSVIKTITVGTYPHGIAIHPSGSYVYTANVLGDSLSVISTSSNSVIKTVSTGRYPFFPAIDSSGQYLYVSNYGSNTVTVVDVSSNTVVGNIPVGSSPHGISVDSTGLRAYVANEGGNSISVIDTSSRTVITTESVGTTPIAFGNFVAEPGIPSPIGANEFAHYTDAVIPLRDSDPSMAKPIGLGTIAGVGATLSLSLGAYTFSSPMDVYLGLSMPAIDPSGLFLFTPAGLQVISAGMTPWKVAVTDISGVVLPDLDALILPTGTYTFYLLVVPAGTPVAGLFVDYYLWGASLSVVRGSDVANKAIALFGTDLAAAAAIFLAIDNGYSLDQIVTAIYAGTLSSIGEIQGAGNPSSGPRAGAWKGSMANKYCGDLDPASGFNRRLCIGRIEVMLEGIEDIGTLRATQVAMLRDVGYNSAQVDKLQDDKYCCNMTMRLEIECCFELSYSGGCGFDCWSVQPADPPTRKLTETLIGICDTLGGNRDSRTISKNPFMPSQAPAQIPDLKRAFVSDSCTPTCTDNDGDGYYIQSGCGTGGAVDCKDSDRNINPGRPEICADGVDNNCDGKIDTQDPGCNPPAPCTGPDCCKAGEKPCGTGCMPAGNVCCGESGNCSPGYECCGTGCMPAGSVCCDGLGVCPAGCTCDYQNEGCICSGAGSSDFLAHDTKWQPVFEWTNNYGFISPVVRE